MKQGVGRNLVVLIGALCLMLAMTSCGKTVPLTLGEKVTVENHVEFTAENVMISPQVFPPISGSEPMGWVLNDEEKTYVTIITTIKNLGEEDIIIDDLWKDFFAVLDEEYIDGTIVATVAENGTKLDDSKPVEAGKTRNVYFITEVAKADLSKLTRAEFDFGGTTLTLDLDTGKRFALTKTLKLKETYKVKNLGNVTPKSMKFMEELEPTNPGYTYDYYVPQTDDDKLLVLTTKSENTTKKKKSAYRYLNMLVFVDDEVYLGDVVAEDAYAANITGSEKLSSGDTRNVYALVNLPKSVKKADCEIYVYIDGKYYQYEMK